MESSGLGHGQCATAACSVACHLPYIHLPPRNCILHFTPPTCPTSPTPQNRNTATPSTYPPLYTRPYAPRPSISSSSKSSITCTKRVRMNVACRSPLAARWELPFERAPKPTREGCVPTVGVPLSKALALLPPCVMSPPRSTSPLAAATAAAAAPQERAADCCQRCAAQRRAHHGPNPAGRAAVAAAAAAEPVAAAAAAGTVSGAASQGVEATAGNLAVRGRKDKDTRRRHACMYHRREAVGTCPTLLAAHGRVSTSLKPPTRQPHNQPNQPACWSA